MNRNPTVTVIVTSYKVGNVLAGALRSVYGQDYPIQEILVIDNHSADTTVPVAKAFVKTHRKIPIRIIERDKTYGLSESYNLGAKLAKTSHIVTLHADGVLPTGHELRRLVEPFLADPSVVAAGPILIHRKEEWLSYPFWQKCLLATSVGREVHSGNGKFDCFNRRVFLRAGGFDTKHFRHTLGAEDIDMHLRLRDFGKVVNSAARVIHAHPVESGYTMMDWIRRRRFLAVSYGRYVQIHFRRAWSLQLSFFVKPALALLSLFGLVHPVFFLPVILFPFFYLRVMFLEPSTRRDRRILLLPFLLVFLVYYESVYFLSSVLFLREARYNTEGL